MTENTFKEAIMKDAELGERFWSELEEKSKRHPLYTKLLKEGLYSDVAGALGAVQDVVWAAARPATIGREIIKVIPTKNVMERFPKEIRGFPWVTGEAPPRLTGARAEMQDIYANLEIGWGQEWTESYVEDASWNVMEYQLNALGREIAYLETEKIVKAYTDIPAGDLAGGAEITITDGAPTWSQVCALIKAVEKEDFHPNVIAMNPDEFGGLRLLDQFVNSLYLEREAMKPGVIYHTTLGINFISSSLVTKSLCIDTNAAAVMLLRRDLQTKPYEDPSRNVYGVVGTERLGLGVLRTKAVARGTN